MAQLTTIKELNPDRVPVTVKATVISLWGSPRPEVAREGRLEDETGFILFTLWADSPVRDLEKNRKYIFHRAGLGKLDGKLRVEIDHQTAAYPIAEEADVYRTMLKITQLEETERKRFVKGARITAGGKQGRSRRNVFSIAIAAGLFIWGGVMILQYTEPGRKILETAQDLFRKRRTAVREKVARQAVAEPREGAVEEVIDGGTFRVLVDGELWTIAYLGLETPSGPARGRGVIDPVALQAQNFNRFRVGNRAAGVRGRPVPGRRGRKDGQPRTPGTGPGPAQGRGERPGLRQGTAGRRGVRPVGEERGVEGIGNGEWRIGNGTGQLFPIPYFQFP